MGLLSFSAQVARVMLLASLLAHELAHAVVARRAGVSVERDVGGFVRRGDARSGEAKRPKPFRIAFAGPAPALALAGTGIRCVGHHARRRCGPRS